MLLILILSLAVTACGDRYGVKEGESYIYCMNTDKTGLVKVAAKISGNSAIKKAESVIDEMKKPTNEIEYTGNSGTGEIARLCFKGQYP